MKCPNCGYELEDKEKGVQQKQGMIKKVLTGNHVSRAPFGYKLVNKELIPDENFREVEKIFEEFLQEGITLSNLSKKYKFSVNGLKKILRNFVYIGKVKFNGELYQGNHQPIVSPYLFNKVQDKLNNLCRNF